MLECVEVAKAQLGPPLGRSGAEALFLCPWHEDHHPSLWVHPRKNAWWCGPCGIGGSAWELAARFAGVPADDKKAVARWLGEHGLTNGPGSGRIAAEYVYQDAAGRPLLKVVRYHPKAFSQCRFEAGLWRPGLKDQAGRSIGLVPYRLPQLLAEETIYVCEGEKDCDRLAKLGLTATTNPMGAGQWREEYSSWFGGKNVIIVPDHDEVGRDHARAVARSLGWTAQAVKIVDLPGLAEKGDVSDWLQQGHSRADLLQVVEATGWLPREELEDQKPTRKPSPEVGRLGPSLTFDRPWPAPLAPEAFQGIAGELARLIEPHTEADTAALLVQFLVAFGNAAGRSPHWAVESTRHGLNLFAVTVGESAKARKGTSWDRIRHILSQVDTAWSQGRISGGLSSGEGLIWHVRDPIEETKPVKQNGRHTGDYETVVTDQGIEDKRLLLIEDEFAGVLRVLEREGNKLSAIVRRAFDCGDLSSLVKSCSTRATGAHISVIGHITRDELLTYFSQTERGNGFGNRFLWVSVRRSKYLPAGGRLQDVDLEPLTARVRLALQFAQGAGELRRDPQAEADWETLYPALSEGRPGLLGSLTARAEALTMRLAAVYAVLDRSRLIRREHLQAGLAVWRYCEASAKFIFGDSLGDPVADELLKALQAARAAGLTRSEVRDFFSKNKSAAQIGRAVQILADRSLIEVQTERTADRGRPTERYFYTGCRAAAKTT